MEMVANAHERTFVEWAKDKPEVLVLSADLTSSVEIRLFKQTYPERFISMGLTEQHMMSFAAGLAREGYYPFLHTFAVFLYRRPYDQLAMSVAYANLPVRLVGFLPGITTPGGASHQAIDDIGVVRMLPNMTIVEAGDASEVEQIIGVAHQVDGPVYIRQLRGEVPRLFDPSERMALGRARHLSTGTDITLLSSGICTEEAMRATAVLKSRGVGIEHLHVSTLKPFDDPAVTEAVASANRGVITMENHSVVGGLGSAVADLIAENGLGSHLRKIGLRDTFAHGASRPYLMKHYGLDATALVREVEQAIGEPLGITADDLASARLDAVHSLAKAEAL
ncbi:MAG: transketolase [Actinobacteria bacterium]|nr:transketolase [Actinomycetota bacterium]